MTGNFFHTCLYKQDRIVTRQKTNVALIIGTGTVHLNINGTLKSIKLIILLLNTTSIIKSMDQGIITSFKPHYYCHFVQHG